MQRKFDEEYEARRLAKLAAVKAQVDNRATLTPGSNLRRNTKREMEMEGACGGVRARGAVRWASWNGSGVAL